MMLLPLAATVVLASAPGGSSVEGRVQDTTGGTLADASVSLVSPQQAPVASTRTDAQGRFRFEAVPPGSYLVVAQAPGFAAARTAVAVKEGARAALDIVLEARVSEEVTVTARPGSVDDLAGVAQRVNVIGEQEIALRAKTVVAQAATEEPGVHLQRTSPTIGEFYVRGLTGTKVNVYVDGVRYTTGAQRGGVGTFFNLVDPAALESVEVLRGPSSAEYGSDALGGSVQFLTRMPTIVPGGGAWQGSWDASFGSADVSYGSALNLFHAGPRLALAATLAGRRSNTLRTGRGLDSHNSVTRFFGLSSEIAIGERMPDTAFTQYGGRVRLSYALSPTSRLTASYLRGQQDGGKRYDQLLGGDGNLVADLRSLMMDSAFVRWEKTGTSWVDRLSLTWSFGAQREERVNQGGNGNPRAAVNHEPERTVAHGGQLLVAKTWGAHSLTAGGDLSFEKVTAPSFGVNPVTNVVSVRRGRVPDGATSDTAGVFVTDAFDAVPGRLRLSGAVRWGASSYEAKAADAPVVSGQPLWPDDSLDASSFTFRAGAVFTPKGGFRLAGYVARGYRVPNITDLGTFGLTGSGYEVSNREVEGLGATVGTTAGANAVSTGDAVRVLDPETSLSCELTAAYEGGRWSAEITGFLSDIDANIAKQALVLPPGAVGTSLGGETITRQLANGVVFVPVSPNPVLVRANFDEARIRGLEGRVEWRIASAWTLEAVGTYIHAKDRTTGLPPNIEGGTPAPEMWLSLRYSPRGGRRFWVEPYLHAADRQSRLSSLDLDDRRTGASRSRTSIAAFFTNGARARGLVGSGADGIAGNADDVLLATGETLPEIQDRVLGAGVASSSLYTSVPGYVTFGLRGGLRFGTRHHLLVDFENLGDRNYRGISWGLDAPGRGAFVRYRLDF
jgi:outer membrane receptor protein involved in Fe transport